MRVRRWIGCLVGVAACGILGACDVLPTDVDGNAVVPRPQLADSMRAYASVAAGFVHTCALSEAGQALCWGNNDYDQLGAASTGSCDGRPCSPDPVLVTGGTTFMTIASGWVQNCAITSAGEARCWGGGALDGRGYLGDGALSRSATPVRVVADSAFRSIVIGDGHTCALTESGRAYCWGQNDRGAVGDGTTTDRPTPVPVATDLRFASLTAGAYHTCGVTAANEAWCWGDNRWGQLGIGDVPYNSTTSIEPAPRRVDGEALVTLAAGWEYTCGLTPSGAAQCWGRNDNARQLGDGSAVTRRGTPGHVSGDLRFAALSAGALAACGRTTSGDTYCWGTNYHGSLGNGESGLSGVGRPVMTLGGPFQRIAIGQAHACAIAADARLWCWGDQSAGQF